LKTDDDTFNVLPGFVEYLDSLAGADMDNFVFVGGLCSSGHMPHRNHSYFVPHNSYPGPVFPQHCKVSNQYGSAHINVIIHADYVDWRR